MTAEMLAIAQHLRDPEVSVTVEGWRFMDSLESGDPAAADASLRRRAALAHELRQPEHDWWMAVFSALRDTMEGRYAEAEQTIHRAYGLADAVGHANASITFAAQQAEIEIERGQLEETLAKIEAFLATRRDRFERDAYSYRKAQLLAELGRLEEARRDFDRLAVDDFAALPFDMGYTMSLASLAVVCARLGDEQRAVALYDRLKPTTGRNLALGIGILSAGPSARYQGLLATTMRRYDVARAHFEDALAMCTRMGWAPMLARTQCDYAAMLLRRNHEADRAVAKGLLDAALDTARRLGMELLAAHAAGFLEQCDGSWNVSRPSAAFRLNTATASLA